MWQTDKWTDRPTDRHRTTAEAALCIAWASRGKNPTVCADVFMPMWYLLGGSTMQWMQILRS